MEVRHIVYTTKCFPNPSNGKHKVIRSLALEQILAGCKSEVIVLTNKEGIQGGEDDFEKRIFEIPSFYARGGFLSQRRVSKIVGNLHDQLIYHIHDVLTPASLCIARYLHRKGIPYVVTPHAGYLPLHVRPRAFLSKSYLYLMLVERWMLSHTYAVVATSSPERDSIKKFSPRTRVELVLNGAYSSERAGRPERRAVREAPGNTLLFGYCSRLAIFHKGIDHLLEGFARYKRGGGKAILEMIGGDNDADAVRRMIDHLGLTPHVTMLGPKYGAEKDDLMRRWRFFALTSRFEGGAPLAATEAAILGVPLLLSKGTNMHPLVTRYDAGVVVEDLSARGVKRALQAAEEVALTQKRWETISRNAYEMAITEFDWTCIAASLEDLYAEALQERPALMHS